MKDKLKKLYHDHEDEFYAACAVLTGIGFVAVVSYAVGFETSRRHFDVVSADVYQSMSGSKQQTAIIVNLKKAESVVLRSNGFGVLDAPKDISAD